MLLCDYLLFTLVVVLLFDLSCLFCFLGWCLLLLVVDLFRFAVLRLFFGVTLADFDC